MEAKFYKRYDTVHRFVRRLVCPVIARKLNFSGDEIPSDRGPMFILCNHNTDFDFLLLTLQCEKPLDFVATETMLRMGSLSRLAARTLKPVLHDKGSKGAATIKQIVERIKDGRNVVLFPEGNRSFDGRTGEVSNAIGKIAKMSGGTLVVYRITGGYFTTPRWGRGIRRGRMNGKVMGVYSLKQLAEMNPPELLKVIRDGLMTDAYEEQKENPASFKSKVKAEYLESLLFTCPDCKKIGSLRSKGDVLSCECGYKLIADDQGYLKDNGGIKHKITDLFADQKDYLNEMTQTTGTDCIWSDEVRMQKLSVDHSIVADEAAVLQVYRDRIEVNGNPLKRDDLASIDIVQRNRLIIHVIGSDVRYEFTGEETFNAVKYRIWFEISFA